MVGGPLALAIVFTALAELTPSTLFWSGSEPGEVTRAYPNDASTIERTNPVEAGSAQAVLNTLPVKGRASKTGYYREQFGQAWTDDVDVQGGHNGCDTRNDVLRRDLTENVIKAHSNGCTVMSGALDDPYSGKRVDFVRGGDSSAVQIDHIVSLSNAWQTGAQQTSLARRKDLANDPFNLWAVDGPLNQQKSDGDAATWLPPNTSIRCEYVARQVAVKKMYGLWLTAPERDAITRVLDTCPGEPLPAAARWTTPDPVDGSSSS
ncbi:HNH endonuclease family protein [Pedococcus sp. KACC 23699]|uniref:HNH endonuclease family protein n=1 Tax=Pedococcus sp. KACC 23699 TaxID=3149228 RepID=A0AAU7JYP3_9MICO